MSGSRPSVLQLHRRRQRRRVAATATKALSILVACLVVLALGVALALYRYANGRIDRVDLAALGQDPDADLAGGDVDLAVEPLDGILTILVVGTDSREGLSAQDLERLGTEAIEDSNTDTLLLLQVSPARETVAMVSFPRDLRIAAPELGEVRINRIYEEGGRDTLVAAIRDLTGVRIDHYVEVDLAGFIRMTDALGGVEVCLEEAMRDEFAGLSLPAGCQTLDGFTASGFVRSRRVRDEFGPDSDYGRINRQHYFVRQAMAKVTSLGTLLNPLKVRAVLDAVDGAVTTDRALDARLMLSIANTLKNVQPGDIEQRVVPSVYSLDTGFGHLVEPDASLLFAALREGRPLPSVGLTGPVELVPDDVRVDVVNGARVDGLAGRVAEVLGGEGFVVQGTLDALERVDVTRIEHRAGDEPRAALVARFLPAELVVVEGLPTEVDVRIVLGADAPDPDTLSGPSSTTAQTGDDP